MQEIRNEATAKNFFKGNENERLQKRQLLEEKKRGKRTGKVMENGTTSVSDSSERSWAARKQGTGF